ncbi:MAG: hypothetical protein V4754_15870 [Pseudomonadota bacterium]
MTNKVNNADATKLTIKENIIISSMKKINQCAPTTSRRRHTAYIIGPNGTLTRHCTGTACPFPN